MTITDPPVHHQIEAQDPHGGQLLSTIKTLGSLLDDLERVRIMNGNRVAALERDYGSSIPHLDVIAQQLRKVEHEAGLELIRAWRTHPLAPWAKGIKGVGEKSIARLISHTGDPGVRPNPAKLWAYCGLGDPARKRRKGMTQEEAFALGNPDAKKQCWKIGEALFKRQCPACRAEKEAAESEERARNYTPTGCSCALLGFEHRVIYAAWRVKYADKLHDKECVRCGPAGKPAAPGSPWSLKHQHEAAKRNTVKVFLKDLWVASRHSRPDDQRPTAGGDPK